MGLIATQTTTRAHGDEARLTFAAEMRAARDRIAAVGSSTIGTHWGPVQYLDRGAGVPVFVSHGVLGGHDNIRELVDLWFGREFRAIGPSRFGYLGSAMPPHATVADQADVYVALLDHLGVERVVLCGFSAGGPAAIQFALRHAERLDGLILGSSYLPGMGARSVAGQLLPLVRSVAGWEWGWWLLKRYRPQVLARIMGVPKGWDTSGDRDFLAIRRSLFPIAEKRFGVTFDAVVSEPASNVFPLEDITVPTLFVHAADDRLAPYEHVEPAVRRVPRARLVTIEAGGHLFLKHAGQVRMATSAFIAEVTGSPAAENGPRMTRAEPRRSLQSPDGIRTQLVSLGTGTVLALLGAAEARRLARADPSEAQKRARQLGFIRTGVAAAFLIKPTLLPRLLGMDDDDRSASRWLPRLFAVRELIIGGGAIADSTRGRDPYPALLAISAVDGVESLLLLEALRRRELPRARALGFVLADLGSATAFPIVLKRLIATTPSSRDPAVHPS